MKAMKRIRTVLYGDQRVSAAELEVLHTPAMQRLYGLRQLGLTDRVFVDASHSRFHHVVGVLLQTDKLVSAIVTNLQRSDRKLSVGPTRGAQVRISAKEMAAQVTARRPVIRLIGLLHDLTHAPFGHTIEDEIQLVRTKHDDPARQADAFYRLLCQLAAWLAVDACGVTGSDDDTNTISLPSSLRPFLGQGANSPLPPPATVAALLKRLLTEVSAERSAACWRLRTADVGALLAHLRCAMTALLHLEVLHKMQPEAQQVPTARYDFQQAIENGLAGTEFENLLPDFEFQPHRDAYMLDVVGNTVCADLLDYAKRDSHYAGLRLEYDPDRIAENFTLVSWDASTYARERTGTPRKMPPDCVDPFAGWCVRTAISLVSHKYRTDVPSELMNLLNVRFYLYERAIYHPTKCAAGAMLGTALQLLGWRGHTGNDDLLPPHLRFVGDDVFLHDVRASAEFLSGWLAARNGAQLIAHADVAEAAAYDQVHNGLIAGLMKLRVGQSIRDAQAEVDAARVLLDRLSSRRFFRQVFRALPSSRDARLQAGAQTLADLFRDAETRYKAERLIEKAAELPMGSVAIHCPRRQTAEKIANVLLTQPKDDADEICKLRDIGRMDRDIFGDHERAVQAVEQMYASMWRLVVYLAPEHMEKHQDVSDAAGRVIFETVDEHGRFEGQGGLTWTNDRHLASELKHKLTDRGVQYEPGTNLTQFGELVGRLADDLVTRNRLGEISADFFGTLEELPSEARVRLEAAIRQAFPVPVTTGTSEDVLAQRQARLMRALKSHVNKPRKKDLELFQAKYAGLLATMDDATFDTVAEKLETAINETRSLEERAVAGGTQRQGWQLDKLYEVFDEILTAVRQQAQTGSN